MQHLISTLDILAPKATSRPKRRGSFLAFDMANALAATVQHRLTLVCFVTQSASDSLIINRTRQPTNWLGSAKRDDTHHRATVVIIMLATTRSENIYAGQHMCFKPFLYVFILGCK